MLRNLKKRGLWSLCHSLPVVVFTFLLTALFATSAQAEFTLTQETTPASTESTSNSTKKKQVPFRWSMTLEHAQKRAQAEGKPILILFTGPDWCPPCIKLEKEVLNTFDFKNYVSREFIPLMVASYRNAPQSKQQEEQYETLMTRYGIPGVPHFIIINAEGKVTGRPDIYSSSNAADYPQHIIAAISNPGSGFGLKSWLIPIGLFLFALFLMRPRAS